MDLLYALLNNQFPVGHSVLGQIFGKISSRYPAKSNFPILTSHPSASMFIGGKLISNGGGRIEMHNIHPCRRHGNPP